MGVSKGAGYTVHDLGVNVDHDRIVAEAAEHRPDIVGLSALLTTSMPAMQRIIDAFRESGLDVPIIVVGAPVTQEFADAIGADGYGGDAPGAVAQVDHFVRGRPLAVGHAA